MTTIIVILNVNKRLVTKAKKQQQQSLCCLQLIALCSESLQITNDTS